MIDGNFGNISAGILFSKVEYQLKRWYLHVMSLHGKVAIASRGLLIFFQFFLNSNDDMDAILSTDLGNSGV